MFVKLLFVAGVGSNYSEIVVGGGLGCKVIGKLLWVTGRGKTGLKTV